MIQASFTRLAAALLAVQAIAPAQASDTLKPEEIRAIAREAYIYGYPMVDGYRVQYDYFADSKNREFKAPWNQLHNTARVYTPDDRSIVTPNSDTPYSMIGLDLRAEPIVLTVPAIDPSRYFSIQLIDAYTFNFAYIGSRATGYGGGKYLVAGPDWKGEVPPGIDQVFRSETNLGIAIYRTQLFGASDLDNVKKIQTGYRAQPLSAYLGQPMPAAPSPSEFLRPLSPEDQKSSVEFFNVLSFVLGFCPTHPSEVQLRERFASIHIGAGQQIDFSKLPPETLQAYKLGIADAWEEFARFEKEMILTGKVTSGDVFGSREYLKNNYLYRMAAALLGLYGNSKAEAIYPAYRADAAGQKLDASKHRYRLRFPPDQFPPTRAFWSVTMYGLPESLLVANPIHRYLINSPMIPSLRRDADGGVTIYIQAESPGADKESNWLPAPKGPFWIALRLYWPEPAALDGTWKQPPLVIAD